ncbi:MAG TPA: hypothetical protein VGV41_08245 [Pseudolabrys sp.]|uniref:hypothetical protein n=1 Tax=Pseudolabrys sp. TaxID=1960880 RepID=UPI002DDD91F9|nr:hypothetical protein [Pseudolabrys sp.]HEV2628619.1 hypothetical protein [Pseudolabrys sp.]
MTETMANANAAASTLFLGHNGDWWDSWLVIFAVIAGVAATAAGVMTAGSIISHKREAVEAEKALGKYKLETGKQIADANERAAKAEERAADAKLALEKYKAPRSFKPSDEETQSFRAFSGSPFDISINTEPEPEALAYQIADALVASGWEWKPVSAPVVFTHEGKPQMGIVVMTGVFIQITTSRGIWEPAALALEKALKKEGIEAQAQAGPAGAVPPDAIHIKIGRKP